MEVDLIVKSVCIIVYPLNFLSFRIVEVAIINQTVINYEREESSP